MARTRQRLDTTGLGRAPGNAPLIRSLPAPVRALWALLLVVALSVAFGARACWAQRWGMRIQVGEAVAARWARAVCRVLPLNIHHEGTPSFEARVLVANHRSYLDVVALLHGAPCGLLAKAEVGGMPLLGGVMRACGVTFVAREHKGSRLAARHALIARAQAGGRAALFPEGTTTAAPGCLPFRPGIFFAAAAAALAVQPVALHYADTAVPYVDDDHLLPHFLTLFQRRTVPVTVAWGPVLRGSDGADLQRRAQAWVATTLRELAAADPVAGGPAPTLDRSVESSAATCCGQSPAPRRSRIGCHCAGPADS